MLELLDLLVDLFTDLFTDRLFGRIPQARADGGDGSVDHRVEHRLGGLAVRGAHAAASHDDVLEVNGFGASQEFTPVGQRDVDAADVDFRAGGGPAVALDEAGDTALYLGPENQHRDHGNGNQDDRNEDNLLRHRRSPFDPRLGWWCRPRARSTDYALVSLPATGSTGTAVDMNEYVEYLKEVFELFGPVTARRMFGGYGLYHDGLMFGLVGYGSLYLKADAESAGHFERRGLAQFEYAVRGKQVKLSYYLAPDEILENRDEAALWARRSFEAALRAAAAKAKPARTRKRSRKHG